MAFDSCVTMSMSGAMPMSLCMVICSLTCLEMLLSTSVIIRVNSRSRSFWALTVFSVCPMGLEKAPRTHMRVMSRCSMAAAWSLRKSFWS